MLDEDIEAQQSLISPDDHNTPDSKTTISFIQRIKNIKNIKKCNRNILCDWIIVIILVVCIVATIVIITYDETK